MEVGHGQQLGLALGQPFPSGGALALRAMPVAATVVGDDGMRAVLAARDMPAERRCAAALDGCHHLQLVAADVTGMGLPPCRSVIAEDIRDLQRWSSHSRRRYRAGGSSISRCARLWRRARRRASGLSILAIIPIATRV